MTFDQLSLPDIDGRHVLIVDDILDSGRTLRAICEKLHAETKPKSLRSLRAAAKDEGARAGGDRRTTWASTSADEFVVGYGLDYQERYRNLPFVGVLRGDLIAP